MLRYCCSIFLFFLIINITFASLQDEFIIQDGEKKLSDQILAFLEHYKQEDPVGVPGLKIPDPKTIKELKKSFSVATMTFNPINVYGLSKFRIVYIKSEVSTMQVHAALYLKNLNVRGNYVMRTWLSRAQGPFQVNVTDINVKGFANIAVERDGKLRAQDINIDIGFANIALNFENLGIMASIFQGILNSIGSFLFDSIKPSILQEAYATMRLEMNKNLDKVFGDKQFPNSISPLDMVIADARRKVQEMGYDPFYVKDYNSSVGLFRAELSHTWVFGLSSFYRVGNITLSVENNTLIADFEIGTQKLEGQTQWYLFILGGLYSRAGTSSFSIDYITARVILGQPLDTRKRPQFRDFQLEVGNIQVRCDGAGTVDYLVEFLVNILPNLLRYQITDAIEGPIRDKVQERLNYINVEDLIKKNIPEIEKAGEGGFKLPQLTSLPIPATIDMKNTIDATDNEEKNDESDEDEFWKFD